MDAVYPASASALARGRRLRRPEPRVRRRTTPVTFAEIKEVDEGSEASPERRRPDVLEERRGRQLAECARPALRELSPPPAPAPAPAPAPGSPPRAASEPAASPPRADTPRR